MKNIQEMSDEQLDSEIEEYSGLVKAQQELSRKGLLLPRSGISTISEEDASHTGILRQYVWDLKDERRRRKEIPTWMANMTLEQVEAVWGKDFADDIRGLGKRKGNIFISIGDGGS